MNDMLVTKLYMCYHVHLSVRTETQTHTQNKHILVEVCQKEKSSQCHVQQSKTSCLNQIQNTIAELRELVQVVAVLIVVIVALVAIIANQEKFH